MLASGDLPERVGPSLGERLRMLPGLSDLNIVYALTETSRSANFRSPRGRIHESTIDLPVDTRHFLEF